MSEKNDFYQVSLKLFLKNSKGEILILKGVDHGTFAGYYDFPGGRIDIDEFNLDLTEVLKREAAEEMGDINFSINLKPVAVGRHSIEKEYSGKLNREVHVLYLFFEGEFHDGEIEISEEHTGFEWVDLGNIDLSKYFKSGILEGAEMYLKR